MGKKYLETKKDSLESSILGVWKTAIEEGDARMDGRTKEYREHRKKLESARVRRINKEEVDLDEGKMKELHGYIQDGKSAKEIAKIMKLDVKTIKALMSGYNEEVELDEHGDSHVDPEDREELDKAPSDTAKKMKRAKDPAPNQMAEAQSGDKEAYKKFFDAALKKFKVSSPAELKDDQKKKFYDYIDKNWEGDNEKAEGAMSQVREFKIQSMKAALAQVWGMEEGKNPFKTEDDDEENKKRVKTETGKKAAVIDVNPKTKD
jgi:hypothetical protein